MFYKVQKQKSNSLLCLVNFGFAFHLLHPITLDLDAVRNDFVDEAFGIVETFGQIVRLLGLIASARRELGLERGSLHFVRYDDKTTTSS